MGRPGALGPVPITDPSCFPRHGRECLVPTLQMRKLGLGVQVACLGPSSALAGMG